MKNVFKWVQTCLVLVQRFLRQYLEFWKKKLKNFNFHIFILKPASKALMNIYLKLPGGGGWLKLFFDEVCGLRCETLPISKDFSPCKKSADWTVFSKFSQIGTHFQVFFYLTNGWFYQFFTVLVKWDPLLRFFWIKMGPMSKDFWWKTNQFG